MKKAILLPRDMDLLVTSGGGVGTTFVIDFLSKYRQCNNRDDKDGFKHRDRPTPSPNPWFKAIYVFGNPVNAIYSLFRREYHHEESYKLLLNHRHLDPIPARMTLDEFAAEGVDRFLFERHFRNWHERFYQYPVMFIRYEKIWENLEPLLDFAGIPMSEIEKFPEQKERKTQLDQIPDWTKANMRKIYGEFHDYLEAQPDCWVREEEPSLGHRLYAMGFTMRMGIRFFEIAAKRAILKALGRKVVDD